MNMWSPALYRDWNCDVFRRVSSVRYVWLFVVSLVCLGFLE